LIREGIETTYKKKLQKALEEIEMLKGSLDKKEMYAHPKYVSALVEYITDDFRKSRDHITVSIILVGPVNPGQGL